MDYFQFVVSAWVNASQDPVVRGRVVFGGMVAILTGWCYISSAVHESLRTSRLTELLVSACVGAAAFGLTLGIGFDRGVVGGLVGITLGLGLSLGADFFFPSRRLLGRFVYGIQLLAHYLGMVLIVVVLAPLHFIATLFLMTIPLVVWGLVWISLSLVCLARQRGDLQSSLSFRACYPKALPFAGSSGVGIAPFDMRSCSS